MKKNVVAEGRWISQSVRDTMELARRLARGLKPGDVLLLIGNLGAGKTTFAQGLARALGVKGAALSPTFIIAQTLKGRIAIHHLDFYRLSALDVLAMGIQDYFNGAGEVAPGVLLIEWADRCRRIWPPSRLEIRIRIRPRSADREIHFTGRGERSAELVRSLSA